MQARNDELSETKWATLKKEYGKKELYQEGYPQGFGKD